MRIIDKRKDYYDCCQPNMADDQIYVRTEREERDTGISYHKCYWNGPIVYDCIDIGFCGKVYRGYRFRHADCCKVYSRFLYNWNDIADTYRKYGWEYKRPRFWSTEKSFEERYEILEKENNSGKYAGIFEKYKSPIIVAFTEYQEPVGNGLRRGSVCKINGLLNLYNFQTVYGPVQAYQEISMFLGNMHKLEKEVPYVSDENLLLAKGFDPKWSFRKEPTKKRKS